MSELIGALAAAIVAAAAFFLLVLGGAALLRPDVAKHFLGGFATSRRVHFMELALRVLVGAALVRMAPRMAGSTYFMVLGWVLIITSLALGVLPWRLHQRFAAASVPRATKFLPLIGVASVLAGAAVIAALTRVGGR